MKKDTLKEWYTKESQGMKNNSTEKLSPFHTRLIHETYKERVIFASQMHQLQKPIAEVKLIDGVDYQIIIVKGSGSFTLSSVFYAVPEAEVQRGIIQINSTFNLNVVQNEALQNEKE